ncbi:hypothetical protein JMUB6875_48080 [Nocardia sp. JMUB6875]|uniref:hypothetical protein n=1 Tax=Nocardia sp. JMUB6875 TaxID=3158170 RepID=UPI0032E781FF
MASIGQFYIEVANNLFLILLESGLAEGEAMCAAVSRTADLVARFQQRSDKADRLTALVPDQQQDAVQRYVLVLQDWMRGNDHWEDTSDRYQPQGVENHSHAPPGAPDRSLASTILNRFSFAMET